MTTEVLTPSWHKTTTGKVALALLTLGVLSVGLFLYIRSNKEEEVLVASIVPVQKKEAKLPFDGTGCETIVTNFDHLFDYVKCGEGWFLISKDKVKVPEWTPINDGSPIIQLLNSKHAKK